MVTEQRKQQMREAAARWRGRNRAAARAATARWLAENREEHLARRRAGRIRKARPSKYQHSAAWSAELERRQSMPAWAQEATSNLLALRAMVVQRQGHARWRRDNPETRARHALFHNAKARGVSLESNSLTPQQFAERVTEFNGACAYCLRVDRKLTVDHVRPLSRGGVHSIENVVPACKPCNSRKKNRGILSMLKERGS